MKCRRVDAAPHELDGVAVADPRAQLASVAGPLPERADSQARDRQPVLVGIKTAQRLAEYLGDAVA
ncbi:hypothetical protein D3C83_05150 [compost metagenome]